MRTKAILTWFLYAEWDKAFAQETRWRYETSTFTFPREHVDKTIESILMSCTSSDTLHTCTYKRCNGYRGSDEIYIGTCKSFLFYKDNTISLSMGMGCILPRYGTINGETTEDSRIWFCHETEFLNNIFIGIRSSFPTNRRDANGIKMLMQSIATGRIVVKATLLFLQALSFVSL